MGEKSGMRNFDYMANDEESEGSRRAEEAERLSDESDAREGPGQAARQEVDERLEQNRDQLPPGE